MTDLCRHGTPKGAKQCVRSTCPDYSHRVARAANKLRTRRARARQTAKALRQQPGESPLYPLALRAARIVAADFDCQEWDLFGNCRRNEYVVPRHLLWWILRRTSTRPGYPGIGWATNRDHSTIMVGERAHERRMAESHWLFERSMRLLAEVEHAEQQRQRGAA